jgi:hypothetical protein
MGLEVLQLQEGHADNLAARAKNSRTRNATSREAGDIPSCSIRNRTKW